MIKDIDHRPFFFWWIDSRTEMGNLILDQCQLESAPVHPIKTSGFKTDQREFVASPEACSSESEQQRPLEGASTLVRFRRQKSSGSIRVGIERNSIEFRRLSSTGSL